MLFTWICFGKVDIIAEAPGRLVPKTFVKVVQPADAGVILEVLVAEGDTVKQGQVLARLDPVATTSDQESVRAESLQLGLQLRRIDAELSGTLFTKAPLDPPSFYAQAAAQFEARRAANQQQLRTETAGLEKLQADLRAAGATLSKFQQALVVSRETEHAYRTLDEQGLQAHVSALDKTRDRVDQEQGLAAQAFTVEGLRAAVRQSEQRLAQIKTDYIKELRQERSDVLLRAEKARHELTKQEHKTQALELKAPVDGVVKDVVARTSGAVVSPGMVLLTLVPTAETLRAEVWVKNEDAGFVFPGQAVALKVAAYPFQKYGLLHGKVLMLSPDAAEPAQNGAQPNQPPSANPGQGPQAQFRALVELDTQHLSVAGKRFDLRPGMQVVAEANEGRRTVLEYLISPVKKSVMEAARER